MSVFLYFLIGLFVSWVSIVIYRTDGTSKVPNELYWACLGPFIWPVLLIKILLDSFNDKE